MFKIYGNWRIIYFIISIIFTEGHLIITVFTIDITVNNRGVISIKLGNYNILSNFICFTRWIRRLVGAPYSQFPFPAWLRVMYLFLVVIVLTFCLTSLLYFHPCGSGCTELVATFQPAGCCPTAAHYLLAQMTACFRSPGPTAGLIQTTLSPAAGCCTVASIAPW